jgi:hypothetical protein
MPRHSVLLLPAAIVACGLAALLPPHAPLSADDAPAATSKESATPSREKLIAELEKTLTDATLVGHYTVSGDHPEPPTDERYDLGEVKDLDDDLWSIEVRIRYRDKDVKLPIVVPIRWAKDTPMICVDDLAIPALGTYTARVMIYRDHYAGFWTGHGHGGHLYGMVEHEKDKKKEKKPDADKKGPDAK